MPANFGSLGITGYSNADAAVDANFGQMQASAIQSLGAQVRSDIDQIMTTRAVRQMVPALQQLRPGDPDFPQQAAGVIAQNPMALRHPAGKAAIELLGNAHKESLREQMLQQRLDSTTANLDTRLTAQELMQRERLRSQENQMGRRIDAQYDLQGNRIESQERMLTEKEAMAVRADERKLANAEKVIRLKADLVAGRATKWKEVKDPVTGIPFFFDPDTKEVITMDELKGAPTMNPKAIKKPVPTAAAMKLAKEWDDEFVDFSSGKGIFRLKPSDEEIAIAKRALDAKKRAMNLPVEGEMPEGDSGAGEAALTIPGAPGPQPPARKLVRGPDGQFIFQ